MGGGLQLIFNSQLWSIQLWISVFLLRQSLSSSPCCSKWLHPFVSLWSLEHPSVLALMVHIVFGVRPKDRNILGNAKMNCSLISKKKKSHGRESKVHPWQFYLETALCFKATCHSLVYMDHIYAHTHVLFHSFIPLGTYWAQSLC